MSEEVDNQEEEEDSEDESEDDSEDDSDDDEPQGDVTAVFKGIDMDDDHADDGDDGDDSDDDSNDDNDNDDVPSLANTNRSEALTFDLRNLLALNTHQIANASLYTSKARKDDGSIEIPLKNAELTINDEFLLEKASEGCAKLIEALWKLPMEQSDAGPMVTLPTYDEVRLPRSLPPPAPKQETKWEQFAKAKGIPLNKEKRSRKVFDETTGEWMYRTGYQKANDDSRSWPIMEVGPNDDPFADPWEKIRDEKNARKNKNMESRMRNAERVGELNRGTTNRTMKSIDRKRKAGKEGGNADRDAPLPTGVPVDLKQSNQGIKLRGKDSTIKALMATQRSTASLGKFDKMREGEPERKKALSKLKKRKLQQSTDRKVVTTEGERGLKILNSVMNGGGAAKERARKKGALATGETAYDYEYSDGLGASSFRKKKGRAGAGKLKKLTKKRAA